MPQGQKFYYKFKKNYYWLIANIAMLALLISCGIQFPLCWYWWQMQVLLVLFGVTLLMWCYKYLFKHQVVEVSRKGIKIDHCRELPWNDVIGAEYRVVKFCFKRLPVITLRTPRNFRYRYNFMQKRSEKIGFGAFSVPLYDIPKDDISKISHIITEKVGEIEHR